jgi:hypothetical protein
MQYLGTLPVRSQHHLAVTDHERDLLVNALAFFHAVFDPQRTDPLPDLVAAWQDVARDTHLPSVDTLATRIAQLQRLDR